MWGSSSVVTFVITVFFIVVAENSLITEPDSVAGDSEEILDEDDVLAVSC
jgi:hypothetical protein